MIEDSWERVGKKFFCRIHLITFENEKKCPKCYPMSKGVMSERRTPLSKIEVKAFDMFKKGHSFSSISKQLKVSKSTAFGYVKKVEGVYKADKGVTLPNDKGFINGVRTYKGIVDKGIVYKGVRLHNDCVSFLIEPIDLSMERDCVQLRFSRYKLINTGKEHIQIFPNKLIVQFLDDIEGGNEDDVFIKASKRIEQFLLNFKFQGIKFLNNEYVQVNRHYAIIGSNLAKHFIRNKKKVIIMMPDDKGVRARVDFSHRKPELEFENVLVNKSDSQVWTSLIKDSVENPIDLFSVTKQKVDLLMNDFVESKKTLYAYQEQISLHLKVMENMDKTLKAIQESVKK